MDRWIGMDRILNDLFYGQSHIAGLVGCQSSFCLMKIPMLLRPARAAQRSEAREVCRITPLARTQSEQRRRLALATVFGSSDCLGLFSSAEDQLRNDTWAERDDLKPLSPRFSQVFRGAH